MRTTSSQATTRTRTAHFLVFAKIGDDYECHIGWKYADNSVGLYSIDKKSSVRPPWGALIGCSVDVRQNSKQETGVYFNFENERNRKRSFKCCEMNPLLWKINEITQEMSSLRGKQQLDLLSLYLHLIFNSEGFVGHMEESNNKLGMRIDGSGVQIKHVEEKGGSLKQLEEFIEKAKNCADIVPSRADIIENVQGGKRKRKSQEVRMNVKIKKTKEEKIEESKKEVLSGLEKNLKNCYVGRVDVSLDLLSVSPKIGLPISNLKVLCMAKSFETEFDPSLAAVTVCPADPSTFDKHKLGQTSYHVIHGRHRLEALKKLDKDGKLVAGKLVSMNNRKVTCHVVQTDCAVQINYAILKGNKLAAKFVAPPRIHELLYSFNGLKELFSRNKAIESVERYAKSLSIGPEDITAIKKLCEWSPEIFCVLIDVIEKYEAYQTEDVKIKSQRIESKLMKGETMAVSKTLMRRLSKIDSGYFKAQGMC